MAGGDFQDFVVVVTGGSTGLGRALCAEVARRGAAAVIVNYARSEAEADNGAMRLRTAYALGPSAPDHPLIVERLSAENR